MSELSDDELLDALGVSPEPQRTGSRTPREERIIAGFEDIQRFVEANGRAPLHGEARDIFERLYAVRLARLRALPEAHELLAGLDVHGLLIEATSAAPPQIETLDDEALLAELGVGAGENDITVLKHVRSREEIRAAEEIANRTACEDFDRFKPLFQRAESDLQAGRRQTRPFGRDASIATGNFFVLGGQIVYVAEMGDSFKTPNGETDARLRVIYSNGTEKQSPASVASAGTLQG